MTENVRYVHGTIQISQQLFDEALETQRIIDDIVAGRREWDSSKVDWDLIEQSYEDLDWDR